MKKTNPTIRRRALVALLVLLLTAAPVSIRSLPGVGAGPALALGCDITGDGVVNLSDVAQFSYDFHNGYHARSDINGDGTLDLKDVSLLAQCL